MKSLADSLDDLYLAFGDVPKPREIKGCRCPCCPSEDDIRILLSKPLRDLTGGELSSYSELAFLTVGEEADYIYFLPRILEVACVERGVRWPDIEITGRAIGETKPANWPGERRAALLNVLHAAIHEAIEDEEGREIDGLICAIARMGLDVAPFLERIEASPEALIAYFEWNSSSLAKQKLANAFWDREIPGCQTVLSWFTSPRVSKIIRDGYGLTSKNSTI